METVTNERRHYDGNKKIHQEFSVCQVEDYSFVNLDSEYSFIGKTDEEKSLVCLTSIGSSCRNDCALRRAAMKGSYRIVVQMRQINLGVELGI